MHHSKKYLISKIRFIQLGYFFSCLILYWFFGQRSIDIDNYEEAYQKGWYQFEPVYNSLMWIFKFLDLPFVALWAFIGVVLSVFFSCIYSKRHLALIAIPNVFFLMMTSFSTQLRFAIGGLAFVYLFQIGSRFLIYLTPLIHFSMIIPAVLVFLLRSFHSDQNSVLSAKSITFFFALALGVFLSLYFLSWLLQSLGYGHYLGSKYLVQKSFSSILYLVVAIFVLVFILIWRTENSERSLLFLSLGLLLFSLCFSANAMISGRILVLYFLFEPFVMLYIYRVLRKNELGWLFLCLIFCFQVTKYGVLL